MKNSTEIRRKQTTSYEGYSQEARLETGDNGKVHSISAALENGRNGESACTNDLMERIISKTNMNDAYKRVMRNKGSHGIDGMSVDELLPYLKENGQSLLKDILEGNYKPQSVRRVEIPKPDGGIRLLGIPTVIDRMIQQAIAQELSLIFDWQFSEYSYGFRPGRNAHQAIKQAQEYMNEGYTWVVDIDLEKYFDTVNHDKLMALVARRVEDKRVLKLIRAYLKSGVMINGVVTRTEKGCPQGGPLSPLLSNIMLDELDKELENRNHKFCRYADDNQLYVRSKKAAERVMRSVTNFIEEKLKLKVNQRKSAIGRPWQRKFLGFSFYRRKEEIRVRIHPKSVKRIKEKIKEITSRSKAWTMKYRYKKLKQVITGWVSYFRLADMKGLVRNLDSWARRRLRMCYWKRCKKVKTRFRMLKKLGIDEPKAWEYANTRKGYWRISNSPILTRTFTNQRFKNLGYFSFTERYAQVNNS
ncbi:MAG: group II intron reverse transcriptase/maturase [Bacteroidales bacterium]